VATQYLRAAGPPPELVAGFEQIRRELDVPEQFDPKALAEARAAAARPPRTPHDATDLEFVTIDPASSMDLDQAVFLQRVGPGYRVHYAIADVPDFVTQGSALDAETRRRALTLYSPDRKVPLHPEVLSEDAASLLPGRTRPALLWTMDLDAEGALRGADVHRALVRSRAKLSYEGVQDQIDGGVADENLGLLAEIGQLLQQQERQRGGVSLPGAEQEVRTDGRHYELVLREPLPVEGWNAQISLLTGRAAAQMMLDGGVGILRTMPDPAPQDIGRVRAVARSLDIDWPRGRSYADVIGELDPTVPAQAALRNAAPTLLRGAGYTAFDGEVPALTTHSAVAAAYAHVTAPLRRLVDRWTLEICCCLCAGVPVPEQVRATMPQVPDLMAAGTKRARALDRANIDLVEAYVLMDRVGEEFDAVVLDSREDRSMVQLQDPPVIARTSGTLPLGERARVRLQSVDVPGRDVSFVPADQSARRV
jgi:exoribonuclease R